MSQGYLRCEYMGPETGLQCEIWFEARERKYSESGEMLPMFCPEHEKGVTTQNGREKYIELVNIQREYCNRMDLDALDAHIAKIEAVIEDQKRDLLTARAVKQDKLQNLSEAERIERLKYKVKKSETPKSTTSTPTLKSDPVAYLGKRGLSADKAKDLLTMNVDDLLKKYQQKKGDQK